MFVFLAGIGSLITIQRSRLAKEHKDLVQLWKNGLYQEVFDVSAKELEKKPLDYFLLSFHGFAAYQIAIAQINNQDMITYIDESILSLRKALFSKEKSNNGRLCYMLGKAYFCKGADYSDLAIQYLESAQKSSFSAPDMPEYLGLAYAAVRDYRKSVAAFSQALIPAADASGEDGSANDALLLAIAKSYFELEEIDNAGAYLIHCLDISKDFNTIAEARLLLGNIMLKKGDIDEAERQYVSIIEEGGEFADVRFQLGELYAERGETIRARAEIRKALRIDPNYAPAIARLARMN
jgi:tetratricopeptide (TPR) repeat protein